MLTSMQIRAILQLISDKYGRGYAASDEVIRLGAGDEVSVGHLQAKLSIMLEAAARAGR